jgi:hypothetical protein
MIGIYILNGIVLGLVLGLLQRQGVSKGIILLVVLPLIPFLVWLEAEVLFPGVFFGGE